MNKLILTALALVSFSGAAFASDSALNPLHISSTCENKIFKQVEAQCNRDSKNDESREHRCLFEGDVSIKRNQTDSAYFEASFTVTDADVYTYGVSIESKLDCQFKVVSKN